ncbi:hypothetical protein SAMN02745150_01479 [Brevinema andersonii]|uniref:Uncharacterized protein n=1 Tax=Brevinema andersonii TaxID=34097 RepID=A0A1I1FEJ3_BREAD|nr:hypothetical protein [Brevinema andersonii]SFB97795.1 hypothetical protein SAMN02745150_01479 [Brevinema andersonii]
MKKIFILLILASCSIRMMDNGETKMDDDTKHPSIPSQKQEESPKSSPDEQTPDDKSEKDSEDIPTDSPTPEPDEITQPEDNSIPKNDTITKPKNTTKPEELPDDSSKEDSSDIPENDPKSLWIKQLKSLNVQSPEVTIQKNGWFTVKRTGQATKDYILLKVISGSEAIYSEDTVIGVGRWIPRQITLKIEGQHVKGRYPDTSSWFAIL